MSVVRSNNYTLDGVSGKERTSTWSSCLGDLSCGTVLQIFGVLVPAPNICASRGAKADSAKRQGSCSRSFSIIIAVSRNTIQ